MFAQAVLQVKSSKVDGKKTIITSEIDGIQVEASVSNVELTPGLFYVVSGQPQVVSDPATKTKTLKINYGMVIGTSMDQIAKVNLVLQGRLGKDPEAKFFDSGKQLVSSSLAVSHGRDTTSWFNLKAWDKTAEVITNYTKKGDVVLVTGRFVGEKSKKEGDDRVFDSFVVDRVQLSPKGSNQQHSTSTDDLDF